MAFGRRPPDQVSYTRLDSSPPRADSHLMKRLTPSTYRADTLFPRVAQAMADLLDAGVPVSAPGVFVRIDVLSEASLKAWRAGKVPYLERVIAGSLGKTRRVVRIIALHAHDLNLMKRDPVDHLRLAEHDPERSRLGRGRTARALRP